MKKVLLASGVVMMMAFGSILVTESLAEEVAFSIKASATMKEVLTDQTGKRVALKLDSGDEIEGTVTLVGNSLVHISRVVGKEFYDSVVSIDRISAVRMRVRER